MNHQEVFHVPIISPVLLILVVAIFAILNLMPPNRVYQTSYAAWARRAHRPKNSFPE